MHCPLFPADVYLAQRDLLLQTPTLLNSLLAMALGHGWLPTSIEVMHLHAYFAQALLPGKLSLLQYPVTGEDVNGIKDGDLRSLIVKLETDRSKSFDLMTADHHIGRLEIVDAQFKGQRLAFS